MRIFVAKFCNMLLIKEILKQKGLTQVDLAKMLGCTKQNIKQLFMVGNPRLSTLQSVANALGVEVWELLVSKAELKKRFADEEKRKH